MEEAKKERMHAAGLRIVALAFFALMVLAAVSAQATDAQGAAPTSTSAGKAPARPLLTATLPATFTFTATASATASASATPSPTCPPDWKRVPSPNGQYDVNTLQDVSVHTPDDAWAVGWTNISNTSTLEPFAVHWNGSQWRDVPVPPVQDWGLFTGVAAISANSVWAVGYSQSGSEYSALIEHWDGTEWTRAVLPAVQAELYDVVVINPQDIWAVGAEVASADSTFALHYNGSTWSVVPTPTNTGGPSFLYGVAGYFSNDLWAVGDVIFGGGLITPLTYHWDGTQWTSVPVNSSGLGGLSGVAYVNTDDVWAVGSKKAQRTDPPRPAAYHWDGREWISVLVPSIGTSGSFSSVVAFAPDNVWAVGSYGTAGFSDHPLVEHWDGQRWSIASLPGIPAMWLNSLSAANPGDMFAVGRATDNHTAILHYRPQYNDVAFDNPFYSYIRCLTCRGIVSGFSDGSFGPNSAVTRGQLAKIVSNAAGFNNTPSGQTFADVPTSHPFYIFIERLAAHNVISGYPCGGPGEPCDAQNRPYYRSAAQMSRAQLAKVASNAIGYSDAIPPDRQTFADVPTSNPLWLFVERAALHGTIGGYPCGGPDEPCDVQNRPYYRPSTDVKRGQAAKIVSSTFFPACGDQSFKK